MPRWVTNLLGLRYASAELDGFFEQFHRKPPVPDDLLHAMYEGTGFGGHTIIQNFRDALSEVRNALAQAPTRSAQRELALRAILGAAHWASLYRISNETQHVRAWRHFLSGTGQDLSDDDLKRSLFVKWLVTLCTSSCLMAAGYSLFGFTKATETQCDLNALYLYTVRSIDASVQDYINRLVDEDNLDEATRVAAFKDDQLNPILNQEYATSRWIEDQVAVGSFDVKKVSARIKQLEAKRVAIAEKITSANEGPEPLGLELPTDSWLAKWVE